MTGWAGLSLAAGLLFCALALAMTTGAAAGWDDAVRAAVHSWASPGLTEAAAAVTWLGTLGVLALFGAAAYLWFLRHGRRLEGRLLAVTMLAAIVLENTLKFLFRRSRPVAFFGVDPSTYSFPSGHSLFSLCFYGTLALLLSQHVGRGAAAAIRGAALSLVLVIGASRIYLGVHYPSDVLGGYLAATCCIAAIMAGHRRLGFGAGPR